MPNTPGPPSAGRPTKPPDTRRASITPLTDPCFEPTPAASTKALREPFTDTPFMLFAENRAEFGQL